MNADEIALYNYLYATEGKAAANAFVDKLKGVLNKRARQSLETSFADYAKEHPVSSSAFSTLIAPVKGLGYIGQAADYAADGKIDQNAPYNKFSFAQKAIRSSVNQAVEKNWGAVGSFAYNTGMSMADFLFTSFVSSGIGAGVAGAEKAAKVASNLSLAIMGSGAAADATIDAKDRGLSDNQSFALGTIAGIAEIVTEKVSIENLFSPNWDENAWRYFIKNVIAEGSEEGASDVINLVADMLISGDQNEWQQSIYKYMDLGYSASEAFGRTAADQFGQIGLDMLGGAVSGGAMSGGRIGFGFGKAAVKTAVEQNNIYRATGKMLRRIGGNNTFDNLAKQAFENGENSKSYEFAAKLQDKAAHGKTITDRELGKLSELSKADIIRNAAARKAASDTADSAKVSENADSEKQGAVREQPEAVTESLEAVTENPKTVTESPEAVTESPVDVSGQAETKNTVPADAETVNEDSNGNPDISENTAEASGISDDAGEDYALDGEESEELRELEDAEPFPHAEDSEDEVHDRLWEKASGIPSGEEKDSRLFFEAGISEGDIDEEAAGVIRRISALTDLNIYFYREAAENGTISNGYYDASDNSIHVNLRSNDPVSQIISHELTHSLENTKSYTALQKTVFDYISRTEGKTALADKRARIAEVYRRNGKAHSNDAEVDADILASFVGRKLLTDENAIRYVVGYHRSLGVWMREQITRLKAALGSKSAKTQAFLDKAARLYHNALTESKNAVRSETNGKDSKYSVTQNYDFIKPFAEQVDDFINGNSNRDFFIVSGTPEVFQNVGFNALPVTIDKKHVDYVVNGTKNDDHVFSQLTIKDLPKLIKKPVAIFDSSSRPGRVIALVTEKSKSGKQVIVPIEVDASLNSNSLIMDTNLITSSYGHTSALNQLLSAVSNEISGITNLYYWNKKEAVALMHNAGLQLPGNLPKDGFMHSIRESGSNVNMKLENVTHSQQFKRWFGDWVNKPYSASKVVDADGKPLVVYHGTDADFTVFKSNDGNYWFSASEDYAEAMTEERGGNRVMQTYLNMRKPYYAKLKPSQFSDPNFEAPIIREAKSKGYDGVIIENDTSNDLEKDTFYVVFNPTQIKSATDNIGTFDGSNPDIRYSVSEIQGENEDYGQGVILDTELFKGISPRNWGKTLRDYFYKNLAGKEFTAYDEDGRSEVIHLARKNDRVQKDGAANNHRVADKLARYSGDNIRSLTTVHIPEAIEVSRYKSSSDDHSHQWLDSEGWEYRTVYLQDRDGKIYEAELNIAHGNDRLILYDITNIKQIDKKRKAPEGVVGSSGRINTAGDLAHYPDASEKSISEVGENVNSSSKKSFSVNEPAKVKANEGQIVINENALAKEESRQLNENAPGEYAHAAEERRDMEHAAVEKSIQEAQERENDPNLIVENGLITEEARRLNEEASWEYDRLLQEEYNKRQVLSNNDEGKSVKRENLKKVDKEYLERNERTLLKKLRKALGVPYGVSRDSLSGIVRAISDEYLEKGNISQKTVDTLFERAYDNGRVIDTDYFDEYKHVKDYFRTKAIGVNDRIKSDFADWNAFRQSTMGTLRLVNISENSPNSGIYTVEDAWKDFSEMAPALANKDISADADMLKALFEIVHGIQKVEYRLSDAYTDEQKDWEKRDFENAVYDSIRDFRTVRTRAAEVTKPEVKFDPEVYANMSDEDKSQIAASLIKASGAATAAKRNMEKVSRKFPLTGDEELLVGELLKGRITFAAIDGDRYNLKNIKAVYEARSAYEANAAVLSEFAKRHKTMLIAEADSVLSNMVDTHDKAGINYSTETAERNIRDTFGDNATAEKIIDTYFRPVHKNEAAKTRMMNEYIARVKELKLNNKLSGTAKKAGCVSESAAVQILGEAKGNIEFLENQKKRGKALAERDGKTLEGWKGVISDLWMKNPQLDKPKIEAAVTEFRKIYNELIGEVNRVRVLNGYPAISYRAGYFPHFSRNESIDGIMDKITALLGGSTEVTELPTEIAGRTGVFKPGIRWFGAALERQGIGTDYDALYGFARYLDGAADIIYHTDDIQHLRTLASQVRYKTTKEEIQKKVNEIREIEDLDEDSKEDLIKKLYDEGGYALSGFVNWLDEYTNILASKKSELDRKIESAIGRKFYNFSKAIEGRVGANMVGGNLASALTNFIPITQAGGSVGSMDLLSGMWDTIKSYKADDGFADRSDFLTNRFGVDALTQTAMQKISSAAGVPMEFIDAFTSNTLVRARYNQNLRSGLSEEAALREADEWAAGLMAGRSKGEMPTIYHSRNLLLKPFTMFQLEVKNQYSYLFKDLPRDFKNRDKNLAKLIAAYFKIFLGAYLFNDLYEKLVGRRSALDPLGIINDTVGDITGYKLPNVIDGIGDLVSGNAFFDETEKAGNAYEVVGGLAGDVADELPFIGGVLGGGRTPINSAFPGMEKMGKAIFNNEWSTKKRVNTALSELGKSVGANVIAPVAGGQIRKIIQGVSAAVSGGSYTLDADGNKILQYPIISEDEGQLIGNVAKGALFGKSSFETAGDWVDSGFKSFSAKATALYDGLCDSGESEKAAFALISNLRGAEKTDEESRSAVQRDIIRHSALTGAGKALAYAVTGASEKEQELISALDDAGADMGAVADALMDIKDINGSKALKGAEKSNAKRSVLLQMGLTDEEKHRIYTTVISDSKESEIAEFGAAGMSFDTFLKIQNEYSEIGERDLKASEKATEFSYTIDGMKLNDKQREVAKDCFAYYSMVPAGGKNEDSTWNLKYDRFVSAGIDRDLSLSLTKELDALEPQDGKKTVSAVQKYRVVINSDLTAEEQDAAFQVLMSADEYAKYSRGRRLGVSSAAYVLYKENMSAFDKNGNGSLSKAEIESLIYYISGNGGHPLSGGKNVKFVAISEAEKAVLWQMMTGSGSLKNNPYRGKQAQRAASEYLRLKNKDKEDKKEN